MESQSGLWNARYQVVREIGDGSFATVYLCKDLKQNQKPRLLSQEVIDHVKVISESSPEIEFVERQSPSDDHQKAAAFLQNTKNLFPDNDIYTLTER